MSDGYFAIQASKNFSSPWWEVGRADAEKLAGERRRHQPRASRSDPHHPTARSAHDLPAPGSGARRLHPIPAARASARPQVQGRLGQGRPAGSTWPSARLAPAAAPPWQPGLGPAARGLRPAVPRSPAFRFPCIPAPPLARTPASLAEAPAPPARPQVFTFGPAPHAFAASAGPCGCGGAGGRGWSRRRGGAATLPTPGSPPRPAPPGPAPPRSTLPG